MDLDINEEKYLYIKDKYGVADYFKIYYKYLKNNTGDPNLEKNGIYFDYGEGIYIGQGAFKPGVGTGVCSRAFAHSKDSWWNKTSKAFLIISHTDFSIDDLQYLERGFYDRAFSSDPTKVFNITRPTCHIIEQNKDLDNFIEKTISIFNSISDTNFFDKKTSPIIKKPILIPTKGSERYPPILDGIYYTNKGEENEAIVKVISNNCILKEGSWVRSKLSPSASGRVAIRNYRNKFAEKIINNKTIEDISFSSLSAAGSFVYGMPMNGRKCFKI
jgi:hypothetical protein